MPRIKFSLATLLFGVLLACTILWNLRLIRDQNFVIKMADDLFVAEIESIGAKLTDKNMCLDMRFANVDDTVLRRICQLLPLCGHTIYTLDIRDSNLGDNIIRWVPRDSGFEHLKTILADGSAATDLSLKELAKHPSLRNLSVRRTSITKEAIYEFVTHNPSVEIISD